MKIMLAIVVAMGIAIGLAFPVAKGPASPPKVATVATVAAVAAVHEEKPVDTVLDRASGGHFLAVADVNGEPVRFVVDTGSDVVALTMEDARRAHVPFDPTQFQVIGTGASGPVRGQEVLIDKIVLDGKQATDLTGVVLEGSQLSLLGHSYLRHLSDVQIKGDQMTLR